MVALKPTSRSWAPIPRATKQERRGGIETGLVASKDMGGSNEAGTPWWH